MNKSYCIRNERLEDYRAVEELTRKAFWDLYVPGCDEHYLVHMMRSHRDFIPELDLVLEEQGHLVGNVMYTKAWLTDEVGMEKEILTFGPVSIHPDYQRKGYGKALLEASFDKAVRLGYEAIVIFGSSNNYAGRGFKSCKKYNVCLEQDEYPVAMLVKELKSGTLGNKKWIYRDSDAFRVDEKAAEAFEMQFEKMKKGYRSSQEEFYILSNSRII